MLKFYLEINNKFLIIFTSVFLKLLKKRQRAVAVNCPYFPNLAFKKPEK